MSSTAPPQPATIDTMPTVYTEPARPPPEETVVDTYFLRGVDGILKVIEMVFSLVTFICASVSPYYKSACGWIQFVSMTAFVLTTILYILHAFKVTAKLSRTFPFKFSEFVYYIVFTVFYFISGVVAAVYAPYNPALGAGAFFAFASMLTFGTDIYFRYRSWRSSNEGPFFSMPISSGAPPANATDRVQY